MDTELVTIGITFVLGAAVVFLVALFSFRKSETKEEQKEEELSHPEPVPAKAKAKSE